MCSQQYSVQDTMGGELPALVHLYIGWPVGVRWCLRAHLHCRVNLGVAPNLSSIHTRKR